MHNKELQQRNLQAAGKEKDTKKVKVNHSGLSLLRDVYGVEHPEQFIFFEEQVHLDHTSFIDGTIPSTKVLVQRF